MSTRRGRETRANKQMGSDKPDGVRPFLVIGVAAIRDAAERATENRRSFVAASTRRQGPEDSAAAADRVRVFNPQASAHGSRLPPCPAESTTNHNGAIPGT